MFAEGTDESETSSQDLPAESSPESSPSHVEKVRAAVLVFDGSQVLSLTCVQSEQNNNLGNCMAYNSAFARNVLTRICCQ